MNNDLLISIQQLTQCIKKHQIEPPDTSKDGIYLIKTEDGICVEIVHNGMYSRMSCDAYETLLKVRRTKC